MGVQGAHDDRVGLAGEDDVGEVPALAPEEPGILEAGDGLADPAPKPPDPTAAAQSSGRKKSAANRIFRCAAWSRSDGGPVMPQRSVRPGGHVQSSGAPTR